VCHRAAPIVNRLYNIIHDDPTLNLDIKMMGIAVENDPDQIKAYQDHFRGAFPIFPDKKMKIWHLIGNPATPYMILVAKNQKVLMTHLGMIHDLDKMLKEIREFHENT
jgi:hypothetical protein